MNKRDARTLVKGLFLAEYFSTQRISDDRCFNWRVRYIVFLKDSECDDMHTRMRKSNRKSDGMYYKMLCENDKINNLDKK